MTKFDVAIIGGGPAGSTVGSLLAKYDPRLKVLIIEREVFPRDHVGESLLPITSSVLDEIGVWAQIESANFPVKIGATYRWGQSQDLWDFEFLPNGQFETIARPSKYEGQRRLTAFQVDRSVYDDILLRYARTLGCKVRKGVSVRDVKSTGDRVDALILSDGTEVTATYYVDASGHSGFLRRKMGVGTDCPTSLQNIAIWDYWQNADWAVSVGIGGTRIQILSQPYGWVWFIPLGPTRTSIGLVVSAKYYKQLGERPEELYERTLHSDNLIAKLTTNAVREYKLTTTHDWSFVADRLSGVNWFLAGESAGFADPILSAGVSLAHMGGRDVAYSILALLRQDLEAEWIRKFYSTTHTYQIRQHMRFAEFWYSANGQFSDLKGEAQQIARDAGLTLTSDQAWQWLGQGGFIDRNGATSVGGYGLLLAKNIIESFIGERGTHLIAHKTHFVLNLVGAVEDWTADMKQGRITRERMYIRGTSILPMAGVMGWLANLLREEKSFEELTAAASRYLKQNNIPESGYQDFWVELIEILEALVSEGWIEAKTIPGVPAVSDLHIEMKPYWHYQGCVHDLA